MKRSYVPLLAAATLAAACGKPKVVVRAELEGGAVADLPVALINYDRKAVMDSLARAAGAPEPAFPQELIQQMRAISAEGQAAVQRGDTAVARVDAMRRALTARVDSVRAAQKAWVAKAYAPFDSAVQKRTERSGLKVSEDTTDASGRVTFKAGDPGTWWVSAHYTLPYSTLDWNVPVTVEKGQDSVVVVLRRANAVEKPAL
jgi:hypothetical protein